MSQSTKVKIKFKMFKSWYINYIKKTVKLFLLDIVINK